MSPSLPAALSEIRQSIFDADGLTRADDFGRLGRKVLRLLRALEKCIEQRNEYVERLIERHVDAPCFDETPYPSDDAELLAILSAAERGER